MLFRTREDYIHGIVCLALAAYKTGTTLLAYCLMSNHIHICVRTENLKDFTRAFRYPYSCYFNSKYKRKGRLGERKFFTLEVKGVYHLLTAIAYILRNPLHHGVCATPFEYPYSSVRATFRKELGFALAGGTAESIRHYARMPDRNRLPHNIMTDSDGLILAECIIDVADLEHQFSTARSYMYYMNRLSGESWEKEQYNDGKDTSPIRISDIEHGVQGATIPQLLNNESGRHNPNTIHDIELCLIIDKVLKDRHKGKTVYQLSTNQAQELASAIKARYHIGTEQLQRCLALSQYSQKKANGCIVTQTNHDMSRFVSRYSQIKR